MAEAKHESGAPLWGVAAQFATGEAACAAVRALRDRGLGRLDAFSPIPIEGMDDALGLPSRPIYPFALGGAALGAVLMFGMCTYATIWGYRFDIGGRPLFSWPAFIVPTVSFGVLVGALAVVAATMLASRLPKLNHPAFNIPDFTRATEDRFFVAVAAHDASFDPAPIEATLAALQTQPVRVSRVPR